jgi:hypothetical protein
VSRDGNFVAFVSFATDLVPGTMAGQNLYLFSRAAGSVTFVGRAYGYTIPAINADGRFVAFEASNGGMYLYDRVVGYPKLVSHKYGSQEFGYGYVERPSITPDGRFMTYTSSSKLLVPGFIRPVPEVGDLYPGMNVYLYDRLLDNNYLISHKAGAPSTGGSRSSRFPTLSDDGRFVTFQSSAADLVAGMSDLNPFETDIYVRDLRTGQSTLVSNAMTNPLRAGNGGSDTAIINGDGSVIVFGSFADNLVSADFNSYADIFAYVTSPARVESISIASGSPQRSVIRSLTVTFDQPVFFAGSPAAAFELTSPAGSVQLAAGGVTGNSVTLTFGGSLTQFGSLIDGKYTLRVRADQVSNIGPLDGNNDGVGGDDFTVNFHRLFGDADGNGFVDALDFRAFRAALGSAAFAFDFDGDGDADAADFVAFRARFGVGV